MNRVNIELKLEGGKRVLLEVFSETSNNDLFHINSTEAAENGEADYQIIEGHSYEYGIDGDYELEEINGIVSQSKRIKSQGRITPGIYVGTLALNVIESRSGDKVGVIRLEVRSVKTSYRKDYRYMLEEITEKCTDLLLQPNSPVSQNFISDFDTPQKTLYQRFAFIKSVLDSSEFNDAVHKFLSSPITTWEEEEIEKDVRSLKRINGKSLRQLSNASNRITLSHSHSLRTKLPSIPVRIKTFNKTESVDTPENRFIRYALTYFLFFCTSIRAKATTLRLSSEASLLEEKLEEYLGHSIFNDISFPNILPLNSPVLQKKEGYREIFRVWLMFDLAAKLVWHGGDDVYSANKRDVAVLYEYWLFFKLLDIVIDVFRLDGVAVESLIEKTKDGLGLKLKQGCFLPLKGVYRTESRSLNVEFSYNKTFSGENEYPSSGSWTKKLRPDYTLSIWPFGIDAKEAEEEELITHIHFDAKYKVEDLSNIFGSDDYIEEEKEDQKKGTYKRGDLLKMHAYRDAIRRTAGAYVLYPGSESKNIKGFHEVLPGLGAFAIQPSKLHSGVLELKNFLQEIVGHFLNRASQRERMSFKTYEVHKGKNINVIREALPEIYGSNRSLIPDETFVLVAYYRELSWDWIIKTGLYNARASSVRGSLRLGPGEAGAKYLLLHSENETSTSKILKITETGPRVFSKQTLIEKGYPTVPSQDYYLVYKVEEVMEKELLNKTWDITKLDKYKKGRGSGLPFSVSMSELMKVVVAREKSS